jgi:hypothetical protein
MLIDTYTKSSWVDDAQRLRIDLAKELYEKGLHEYKNYINGSVRGRTLGGVEGGVIGGVRGGVLGGVEGGVGVQKDEDPELEMKLIALNALMSMDQDEAFPLLAKIVKEDENPKMRERALMILLRSKHPDALPLFIELATKDQRNGCYLYGTKKREGKSGCSF